MRQKFVQICSKFRVRGELASASRALLVQRVIGLDPFISTSRENRWTANGAPEHAPPFQQPILCGYEHKCTIPL
ncbi:CLIP-associating protein 1 [Clarias magur]|uniref:CLIP-associating protein 1 n=1 Tax=Clarias magur TaxID=1594786 RepID=A0A8J4XDM6_CLAMG|nr:CLIP-associating protein 1 [Clarias magur]